MSAAFFFIYVALCR